MTFRPDLTEATRLTRSGKLAEATALIQRLLRGDEPARDNASPAGSPPLIDLEAVDVTETQPIDAQERTSPGVDAGLGALLKGKLRDAFGRLGVGGAAAFHGPRPADEPLPAGASFATFSYANGVGARSYKLYVPSGRAGQTLPLVVMLHGCTQSPDDFAAGTRMNRLAEEQGFLVAYPAQPTSANSSKCWNWFGPEHQERDGGEASLIAGITRQIMQDHAVDANRVYIAGLSAGGAAAAIMVAAYPDLYAAAGVHSGLACGAARDLPSAFAAMKQGGAAVRRGARVVPTIVFHGDQDNTVHPRNGEQVVMQAGGGAGGAVEHGQVTDGHRWSRAIHLDASGNVLCEQWTIHGAGHAWSGGSPAGTYTDPRGPDASREMVRFFFGRSRLGEPAGC